MNRRQLTEWAARVTPPLHKAAGAADVAFVLILEATGGERMALSNVAPDEIRELIGDAANAAASSQAEFVQQPIESIRHEPNPSN